MPENNRQRNGNIVRVGVGVLILKDTKVLLGKRKGSHGAGSWCLPGGHLDYGESFAECVLREAKEETGFDVIPEEIVSLSNDIAYGKHYVTIGIKGRIKSGALELMEPEKCEKWDWFSLDELPSPLFHPTENVIKSYKEKRVTCEFSKFTA